MAYVYGISLDFAGCMLYREKYTGKGKSNEVFHRKDAGNRGTASLEHSVIIRNQRISVFYVLEGD